jgi:acyl-CoA synthetase (AMP-forming)/AMP-acid ligase II
MRTTGESVQPVHSVFEALGQAARDHGPRPFLHIPASAAGAWNGGQAFEMSYAQALAAVETLAARYRAAGYGPGHRVALMLENRPAFLLHYFALNAAGASAVPLNPDCRPAELGYVIGHSGAGLIVGLRRHAAALGQAGAGGPAVALTFEDAFDPAPAPPRAASGTAGPREGPSPGAADSLAQRECALLYTSGTTGAPKGCLLSNAYCLAMGRHYLSEGGLCAVRHGVERLITPLPLFHMNALVASTMAMVLSGGCIIQLDRFHPRSWWADVRETGATIVHYLGVMPALLLAQPPDPLERVHAVRFGFGANANPRDHQAFEARFGFPLIEAWAMTETGAGATLTASREPRHPGTRCIGRPRPGLEIRLVDEKGEDVPEGAAGAALVRQAGAQPRASFFSGYLKDEAATEAAWAGGWFHTGDVMRRGPDGQYHFVDRARNIIRRAGENIAALEVEAALLGHPAIAQVAVIAAPDALRDEEVMACVVPVAGQPADRDAALSIQDWCLARLAYFKAPGYVAFISALPTTATNKVQKARLADFGADPLASPSCFDLRDRKKRRP